MGTPTERLTNFQKIQILFEELKTQSNRPAFTLFQTTVASKINARSIKDRFKGDTLKKLILDSIDASTISTINDYFENKLPKGAYPPMVESKDVERLKKIYNQKKSGEIDNEKEKELYAEFYLEKFENLPVTRIMELVAEYDPNAKNEKSGQKGGKRNNIAKNITEILCKTDVDCRVYDSYLAAKNNTLQQVMGLGGMVKKALGLSDSVDLSKSDVINVGEDEDLSLEILVLTAEGTLKLSKKLFSPVFYPAQELCVVLNDIIQIENNSNHINNPLLQDLKNQITQINDMELSFKNLKNKINDIRSNIKQYESTDKKQIEKYVNLLNAQQERIEIAEKFSTFSPSQRAIVSLDAVIDRMEEYLKAKSGKKRDDYDHKLGFVEGELAALKKLRDDVMIDQYSHSITKVRERVLEAQNISTSPTLKGDQKEQSLVSLFDSTLQQTDEQNLKFLESYKQQHPIEPEGINSLGDVLSAIDKLRKILIDYKKGPHADYTWSIIRSGVGQLTPAQKVAIINPLISYLNNAEAGLLTGRYSDPKIVLDQCMSELIKGIKDTKSKTLPDELEKFNIKRAKEAKEQALEQIEILLGGDKVIRKNQLKALKKRIENDEEPEPIASIQKYANDEKLELKTRQDMLNEFDKVKEKFETAYQTAKEVAVQTAEEVAEIFPRNNIEQQKLVPNYISMEKLEVLVRAGVANSNFLNPLKNYVANGNKITQGTSKPKFAVDDANGKRLIEIFNMGESIERTDALVAYYVDLYSKQNVIETMNEDYSQEEGRNPVAVEIQEELRGDPDCLAYIEVDQLSKRIDAEKKGFDFQYALFNETQNDQLHATLDILRTPLTVVSTDITQTLRGVKTPDAKVAFKIRAALYNAAHQFEDGKLRYELIEEQGKYKKHEKLSIQEQIQKFEEIKESISEVAGLEVVLQGLVEVLEALKKEHAYAYTSKFRHDDDIPEIDSDETTSQPTASEKSDQGISVAHNNYLNNIKMLLAAIKPTFSSDENLGEKIEKITSMNSATEDDFDEVVKLTQEIVTNIKQKNVNTQNLASLNHILDSVRAELEANQQATNSSLVNKF